MDKNRLWVIGSVLVMVIVIALGWVVGVQPQLTATAAAHAQLAEVEQTNAAHEASLAKLKKDFTGIDALKQQLDSLSKSVPFGTNVPAYVDQLDALATASQVTLKSLTVADAVAYTPVAPVAPTVQAAASGAAAPATPTPAPTPTETAAPVPAPGAPPVTNAKITADNFASLAVTISISGTYGNVLNFVNGLQTGPRLFLVTGLTTAAAADAAATTEAAAGAKTAPPAAASPNVDGTISGLIYSIVTPTTPTVGAG
jgi:Tfp pilus assembly protein PilO